MTAGDPLRQLDTAATPDRFLVIDHGAVPPGWTQITHRSAFQPSADDAHLTALTWRRENSENVRSNHRVEVIDLRESIRSTDAALLRNAAPLFADLLDAAEEVAQWGCMNYAGGCAEHIGADTPERKWCAPCFLAAAVAAVTAHLGDDQ